MSKALSTALIGAIINMVLSALVPCLLRHTDNEERNIINEVKANFILNREMLITSSVITAIIIYMSIKAEPSVRSSLPSGIGNFLN